MRNPEFIKGKVEPADIIQGELGDCYFLSALSALAEQGFRIKNLFPSLEISPNGIYMARILHNGEYQDCLLYTSPSPRDQRGSRMPSSA